MDGRDVHVVLGLIDLRLHADHFEMAYVPMTVQDMVFISRMMRPLPTYDNLSRPFSPGVWGAATASLLALGLASLTAYRLYCSAGSEVAAELVRPAHSYANFLLYPLAKIAEPEPLPWFPTASAGKLLAFLWTVLASFLVMFYLSNLRAHMIAVNAESPIDSPEDVLANDKRVFMPRDIYFLRCCSGLSWVGMHVYPFNRT